MLPEYIYQIRNINLILDLLVLKILTEHTSPSMIYSYTYHITYELHVHMILPDHISVHIRDDNNHQVR